MRRYMGRFGTGELRFLPIMVIRTYWLATDPATIYHALSFYKTHPDLHAELATPAALDRIGNGRDGLIEREQHSLRRCVVAQSADSPPATS